MLAPAAELGPGFKRIDLAPIFIETNTQVSEDLGREKFLPNESLETLGAHQS